MASRYANLDEYYATLTPAQRETIAAILQSTLAAFPQLDVKIAWNKPHIHRNGAYVYGVEAARAHVMFHPWSVPVFEAFLPRLTGYVCAKRTFRIPLDKPIDTALLRDLVAAQLASMDA